MRVLAPLVAAAALLLVDAASAVAGEPDFATLFAGRDACFELYDLAADRVVVRSDARRCAARLSPCSTFKVPLALMAFDAGIVQDEHTAFAWDGKHRARDVWNRDQTAASWMRDSVVWVSQRLTPALGLARLVGYLERFDFGNRDMSGGLTTAWLDSSLAISPDEQIRFWRRLWRGELGVSARATELTKTITYVDTSPAGWVLHGKTGSGFVARGAGGERQHGWFVGHVGRGERQFVFAVAYVDRAPPSDTRPAGFIARDLARRILGTLGLY